MGNKMGCNLSEALSSTVENVKSPRSSVLVSFEARVVAIENYCEYHNTTLVKS